MLLVAAALRLWRLDQNGWGAEYYSAAVRSMSGSWHNFLFAAFDPAGFISVDKPPLALWQQALAVKLFGFTPLSLMVPQALIGVASVWVVYRLSLRVFGAGTALVAALLMAISPVMVAVNRTNNMDGLLLLILLLAAWALLVASERGSRLMLCVAMGLVGLAFNVKMLAAFIVLPAFLVVYLAGDRQEWGRRLVDFMLGGLALLVVALPWAVMVQLTPPDQRPYVGSSRSNSMTELLVGHNATSRFFSPRKADAAPVAASTTPAAAASAPSGVPDSAAPSLPVASDIPIAAVPGQGATDPVGADTRTNVRNLLRRLFVRIPTGPLRLAQGQLAAQVSWLLPLAVIGMVAGLRVTRSRAWLTALLWTAWTVTYWLVYSYLGGIIHFYYTSSLAPALSVLAAVGLVALWRQYRAGGTARLALPGVLALTAAWQLWVQQDALGGAMASLWAAADDWLVQMHRAVLLLVTLGALGLLAWRRHRGEGQASRAPASLPQRLAIGLGAGGLLVLPLAWALSSVLSPGQGVAPAADLHRVLVSQHDPTAIRLARFGGAPQTTRLLTFLQANRRGETFLLATSTTQLAAPIIIATGEPVMARGGFHGLDQPLTPDSLAARVAAGQLRFVMLGDVAALSRRMGADDAGKPVSDWVLAHGTPVDPALWREPRGDLRQQLYDMRPQVGLASN